MTANSGAATNAGVATILTFNTFLLDVRLFGRVRVYPAAPFIAERLAALPDAIAEIGADVVCLQEVFRRPHRAFLAERLARTDPAYPHVAGIRRPGLRLDTGLMVLSRHPIERVRPVEFRAQLLEEHLVVCKGGLDCVVTLPDLGACRVIAVHLAAGGILGHPEGRRGETCRARQIEELAAVADHGHHGPTLIAGDFNAGPQASPGNFHRMLDAGYADVFAETTDGAAAQTAVTWDPANPLLTAEADRTLPAQRIDHVLMGTTHGLRAVSAGVVLDGALVRLADGRSVPLSDHAGVLARIEA